MASGSQAPLFLSMILEAAIVPGIDLPGVVAGVAVGIAVGALGAIVVAFAVVGRGGAVVALLRKTSYAASVVHINALACVVASSDLVVRLSSSFRLVHFAVAVFRRFQFIVSVAVLVSFVCCLRHCHSSSQRFLASV